MKSDFYSEKHFRTIFKVLRTIFKNHFQKSISFLKNLIKMKNNNLILKIIKNYLDLS